MNHQKFETLALHAGQSVDETMSRAVPVQRTSSYLFRDTEHAANLFALKELGNIYTRLMNPTQNVLEKRMAALEGGAAALAVASGTSAIYYSIINICRQGDEFIAARNLYGGSYTMFQDILPQFGITVRYVDIRDLAEVAAAVNEKTRLIFTEVIGNPALDIADIKGLSEIAKEAKVPLVVDSTFTPPSMFRPLEHGADIVVHSLTKWLGGHGTGVGGIVIDSGKFDWTDAKFVLFNEPEASYHDLRFARDLGDLAPLAFILRMRLIPLRNLGACISPDNAWMFLQGIETLALRMERHNENSMKVAEFLLASDKVQWVRYPGLENDPANAMAKKQLGGRGGAVVVFGIEGGAEAGRKFIESLELFSHLANVGDAKSLAIHPATTTHSQMSEEQQVEAGITPDLIRLSVGIEHIDDILLDLSQALEA